MSRKKDEMIQKNEYKYASQEVFDFDFYIGEELAFSLDTVVVNEISYFSTEKNVLKIREALISIDLANDIMNGKYRSATFKIVGRSKFRSVTPVAYCDYDVNLVINEANLMHYSMKGIANEVTRVKLLFAYTNKDNFRNNNFNISVK